MVKYYPSVEPHLQEWAMQQALFFTASAPLTGKHINVSPKGLPSSSFSILGPNLCAYVDATGSGIETVSHIQENGRVTIMFCSFGPAPQIMRFFCRGRVIEWCAPQFDEWLKKMGGKKVTAARAVIVLDIFKVQTSCGFAVPYLALRSDPERPGQQIPYLEDRHTLGHWGKKQVEANAISAYRAKNNSYSLDGLPGLRVARKDRGENVWLSDLKAKMVQRNSYLQLAVVGLLSSLLTVISLYAMGFVVFDSLFD